MSQKIAVGYYPSWWTAAPQPAQLDDLPGPRSAEPTAEDIEWAKQVFAEHDRAVAARTRQNAAGSTIAGAKLPTHQRHPQTPPARDSRS